MNPPKAILFDLDNTILAFDSAGDKARGHLCEKFAPRVDGLESAALLQALQEARDVYWDDPERHKLGRLNVRIAQRAIVAAAFTRLNIDAPHVSDEIANEYTLPGLNTLYPGIRSMLEGLYARGMKLGVITSRLRQVRIAGGYSGASQELKETGVAGLFEVVVGYEDTTAHKPHPEPVQLALTTLSVSPQDTIVVGDTPADIEAGRATGCRTCLVTWGTLQDVTGASADFVAATPEELLSLLTG